MRLSFLLIIPARGGSKGIPGKNIILINGTPLLKFSIDLGIEVANELRKEGCIFDVVVSSDSEEIIELATILGAEIIKRPPELADDSVPLDPVILHAFRTMEERNKVNYDVIITVQPTSPLLSADTLKRAIKFFCKNRGNINTLVSVFEEKHLFWKEENNKIVPIYKERKNRQWLEPLYKETGGFVISDRDTILEGRRFGDRVAVFTVPFPENIDIDSWADVVLIEHYLKRQRIAFRVDGDYSIGLGHVYRTITLARRLWAHEVKFFMDKRYPLGIDKVKSYNFNVYTFSKEEEFFDKLTEYSPHVLINDILDTSKRYMERLRLCGCRIVNFEDLGEGAAYADNVINALYEWSGGIEKGEGKFFYGYRYECLREDCYYFPPIQSVSKKARKILVTFGGTDINKATIKVLKALEEIRLADVEVKIVEGIGFRCKDELTRYVSLLNKKGYSIEVIKDVKLMAPLIREADLVVCSNGRTVYEVAAMAVPIVTISQNSREAGHLFSKICGGILNLGLVLELDVATIASALEEIMINAEK